MLARTCFKLLCVHIVFKMPGRPEDHHGDEVDPEKAPLMHSDHEKGNGDLHRLDTPMLGARLDSKYPGFTVCRFDTI